MKEKHKLSATKRTVLGKKVRHLRAEHKIPANVFGNTASLAVTLVEKEFTDVVNKAGETSLIELVVEGEEKARPILISQVMRDPITGNVLHVDLQQVDLSEKVTANVPLELEGESEAVKAGGVLLKLHDEIGVEALPADLPEKFVLNIELLKEIGQEFKVSDLKYDKEKVFVQLDQAEILVVIQEPKVEEEPVVAAEVAEVETTVQGAKKEEGEAGEGEGKPGEKTPADKASAGKTPAGKAPAADAGTKK